MTVTYRTQTVGNVEVFYREAGPRDAPVILLLHGFPTAERGVTISKKFRRSDPRKRSMRRNDFLDRSEIIPRRWACVPPTSSSAGQSGRDSRSDSAPNNPDARARLPRTDLPGRPR